MSPPRLAAPKRSVGGGAQSHRAGRNSRSRISQTRSFRFRRTPREKIWASKKVSAIFSPLEEWVSGSPPGARLERPGGESRGENSPQRKFRALTPNLITPKGCRHLAQGCEMASQARTRATLGTGEKKSFSLSSRCGRRGPGRGGSPFGRFIDGLTVNLINVCGVLQFPIQFSSPPGS